MRVKMVAVVKALIRILKRVVTAVCLKSDWSSIL